MAEAQWRKKRATCMPIRCMNLHPNDNLDQTSSVDAMAAMQEFLNRYPNSKFRDQAIDVIVTTQKKLEKKGFDNAYQYYKMRQYKAAIVALNNFKDNFPDSKFLEEAYYLVIVSEYQAGRAKHLRPNR